MEKIIKYLKSFDLGNNAKQIGRYFYKDFLKPFIGTLTIFKHKPRLFIFLFISFNNFAILPFSFFMNILIYICVIVLLLSPIAETMLRSFEDVRAIATKKEKQRLYPLFNEVYQEAKKKNHFVSDNIQLFLSDTAKIDAFALCKNTIVISTGVLETFNDEQLKALLAHEFAHLVRGDAEIKTLVYFGSSIYTTACVGAYRLIEWLIAVLGEGIISTLLKAVNLLIYVVLTITVNFLSFLVAGSDQRIEYKADEYTFNLGYGRAMIDGLYIMQSMEISEKKLFRDRIMESHPRTAYRIEALENLL